MCCHRAEVGLTGRELAVLLELRQGHTAATIGHRLGISPRTVHAHLAKIYRKLGVVDRMRAVLVAQELGIHPAPAADPGVPEVLPTGLRVLSSAGPERGIRLG